MRRRRIPEYLRTPRDGLLAHGALHARGRELRALAADSAPPSASTGKPAAADNIPEDLAYLAAPYANYCPAHGADEFLDPQTQLLVFQHRAQRLLRAAATKLTAGRTQDKCISEVWNANMLELIAAAQGYIEYVALQTFVRAVEGIDDAGVRRVLAAVCSLFALATITGVGGWGSWRMGS